MATDKKITVNGSTSGYTPSFQDQVAQALLQNGGVKRIQATFQQRLDEAGWSQNLREHVERLFRSGEATTYEDAHKIVMKQIFLRSEEDGAAANGTTNGGAPDLSIPRDVAMSAADTVRKEIKKVLVMEK